MGRIALLLCLAVIPVRAEVYRWVDEQGTVHFGDRPPAAAVEPLEIAPNVTGSRGLRPGERELLDRIRAREARQRQARDALPPAPPGPNAATQRRCAGHRLRLADRKAERRRGCRTSRCAAIDRRVDYYRHLIAGECP